MCLWYKWFVLINVAISSFAQSDVCKEGLYGKNCELTCSDTCRPFQTFPCDKKSGQCSEGCKEGYYGDQCDKQCDCGSRVCYQATGECIESDETTAATTNHKSDNVGTTTEVPAHSPVCDGVSAAWRIVGILFIVLTFFGILLVILIIVYARRRRTQSSIEASDTSHRRFPGITFCFPCFGAGDNEEKLEPEAVPLKDINVQSSPVDIDVEAASQSENLIQPDQSVDLTVTKQKGKEKGIQHGKRPPQPTENEDKLKMKIIDLTKQLSDQTTEISMLTRRNEELKKQQSEDKGKLTRRISELEQQMIETWNNFGLPKNSTYHLLLAQKSDPSAWLQCPHLKFDKETVNVKVAQIDDNMVLRNTPGNPGNISKGFQYFQGTTCTEPLVKTGFYQYFETDFNMTLKKSFEDGEVVMLLGLCAEKDRDVNPFTGGTKNCFLVKAVGCKVHNKICLVSGEDIKTQKHFQLIENSNNESTLVNIGIRLNKDMKRLGVYESESTKELHKTNINIGERIWPMFGFCDDDKASVHVKLTAGSDIKMSGGKKEELKPEKFK